jgi:hypothetical protein
VLSGRDYVVEVRGPAPQGALSKPTLQVFNAAGTLLGSDANTDGGSSAQVTFRPTATGEYATGYYATVGGVGSDEGAYAVGIRFATDDYTSGPATAGVLEVGGSTSGKIEENRNQAGYPFPDRDSFRVTLQAGHSYDFALGDRADGLGTLPYGTLSLYDAAGNWLRETPQNHRNARC